MSPEAVLQRCTVHIAREVELWITRKPKSDAARELLELVRLLGRIETHQEAQICMRVFVEWYRKYEAFINENTTDELIDRPLVVHAQNAHRSTSHIRRALPEMFAYTRYANVPKSSNSIEAFFGYLKDNLRIHRGLSEAHFKDFVMRYLFFNSNRDKIIPKK